MRKIRLAMLTRAASDPALSLKAKGLLLHLVMTYGECVPAAEEIAKSLKEGRDSVRSGMKELEEAGYIERVAFRAPNGAFRKETRIVAGHTSDGFPGPGLSGAGSTGPGEGAYLQEDKLSTDPLLTTSDLTTSSNTLVVNRSTSLRSVDHPRPFGTQVVRVEQEALMTIGGFPEDEVKPTTPPSKRKPAWDKRDQRPPSKWNSNELVAEFSERVASKIPRRTGQTNHAALAGSISRWKRDGVKTESIIAGMDMFFGDPRNFNNAGQGHPAWKTFIWFFQTNQIAAAQAAGAEKSAMQETIDTMRETGTFEIIGRRRAR